MPILCGCLALRAGAAVAQNAPPLGKIIVSGSVRSRVEDWNWFQAKKGENAYTFVGTLVRLSAAERLKRMDWQLELAAPWLANLPHSALQPPPEGPLGLGAIYRSANGNKEASVFLKQGFFRFHDLGGRGNALRLGRFEYIEGLEGPAKDPTILSLKRDRIAHRLLGNFGWSHIGRSLDGAQLTRDTPRLNLTLLGARPTRGVFDLQGWDEIDVQVYYAAATHEMNSHRQAGEGRLFWLYYVDNRDAVKVDNRPAATRAADRKGIDIHTLGAHLIRTFPVAGGTGDLLLWGAGQLGDWGALDHRAAAAAAEVGYQPKGSRSHLWMRGGVNWGSGDRHPADDRHTTFFQVLPTPRIYARFPFYNMMNTTDWFLMATARPAPRWSVRSDLHNLRLSRSGDLWYQGGGAYQNSPSFGYVGRPSGGKTGLANLLDLSADYTFSRQTGCTIYAAKAFGGPVVKKIYPAGKNASLVYLELNHRF